MFALSFELSTTKAIFVGIAVACLLILGVRLIFKDWVLRMENMFLCSGGGARAASGPLCCSAGGKHL